MKVVINKGLFDCTEAAISKAIENGKWAQFDEPLVWGLIRDIAADGKSIEAFKAQALLDRNVPKLVFHHERVDNLDRERQEDFGLRHKAYLNAKEKASAEFGIDSSLWYLWHKPGITLTKIGSRVPVGAMQGGTDTDAKDKYEQSIRILREDGDSIDIMSVPRSLMSILSNRALYALRIYVLLPPDKKALAGEITKRMQNLVHS